MRLAKLTAGCLDGAAGEVMVDTNAFHAGLVKGTAHGGGGIAYERQLPADGIKPIGARRADEHRVRPVVLHAAG